MFLHSSQHQVLIDFNSAYYVIFGGGPKLPQAGELWPTTFLLKKSMAKWRNMIVFFIFPESAFWEVPIAILTSNTGIKSFPGQLDLYEKWAKVSPVYDSQLWQKWFFSVGLFIRKLIFF